MRSRPLRTPRPRATTSAPRRRRGAAAACLAVVLVLLGAACGTSGRTLRDPEPGATAPPRKTSTTTAATALSPTGALSISSPSWSPGGEIPVEFTCDGAGTSPPLTIAGAPAGTVELVLVVRDPDAGGFLHWAVAGIPPGAPSFPGAEVAPGSVELPNARGENAWIGPCPPAGTTHTYEFTLHALPAASGLGIGSPEADLEAALAGATSVAVMTGTYARPS